jgi:hypothetical protein
MLGMVCVLITALCVSCAPAQTNTNQAPTFELTVQPKQVGLDLMAEFREFSASLLRLEVETVQRYEGNDDRVFLLITDRVLPRASRLLPRDQWLPGQHRSNKVLDLGHRFERLAGADFCLRFKSET